MRSRSGRTAARRTSSAQTRRHVPHEARRSLFASAAPTPTLPRKGGGGRSARQRERAQRATRGLPHLGGGGRGEVEDPLLNFSPPPPQGGGRGWAALLSPTASRRAHRRCAYALGAVAVPVSSVS